MWPIEYEWRFQIELLEQKFHKDRRDVGLGIKALNCVWHFLGVRTLAGYCLCQSQCPAFSGVGRRVWVQALMPLYTSRQCMCEVLSQFWINTGYSGTFNSLRQINKCTSSGLWSLAPL